MTRCRVRVDLTDLEPFSATSSIFACEAQREAVERLTTAFQSSPSGTEIVIHVGGFKPVTGIDDDTWLDADRRFQIWFEGAPHVLADWKATSEGRAPWRAIV